MKTNLFNKTIVIAFISFLVVTSCDDKDELICTNGKVYLADNGKTIIACPDAQIGDTGVVNGVTYIIVSKETLSTMISSSQDVTQVCTSKITDMNYLFAYNQIENPDFNQDISNWDVSNVTSMIAMFGANQNFNQDISSWNVNNVTNMEEMFMSCINLNQDLSSWDVEKVTSCLDFSLNTPNWELPKPIFTNCSE